MGRKAAEQIRHIFRETVNNRQRSRKVIVNFIIVAVSVVTVAVLTVAVTSRTRTGPRENRPILVPKPKVSLPVFVLHSRKPFGATDIPFTLRDGNIHVRASFDGRDSDAIIDTGSDSVLCPAGIIADARGTAGNSTITDGNGVTSATKRCVVSRLRIGSFEVKGLPVQSTDGPTPQPPCSQSSPPQVTSPLSFAMPAGESVPEHSAAYALIGNAALRHLILTIDYRKKRLVLYRSDYTPPVLGRRDCDLRFTWGEVGPLVIATHRGEVMRFELDTGWGCSMPGISQNLEPRHVSRPGKQAERIHRISITTFLGVKEDDYVNEFPFHLNDVRGDRYGGVQVYSPAVILSGLADDEDGIFGTTVLSHFCVTIDFPRRRIILRPYQTG